VIALEAAVAQAVIALVELDERTADVGEVGVRDRHAR
jgi:hypothetical protein